MKGIKICAIDGIIHISTEEFERVVADIRADAYKTFAEVIALDIADCSRCPIDCDVATYGNCEKALIEYVKEQNS